MRRSRYGGRLQGGDLCCGVCRAERGSSGFDIEDLFVVGIRPREDDIGSRIRSFDVDRYKGEWMYDFCEIGAEV